MVTRRRWWIAPSLRLGLLAVVAAAVLTIGSTLTRRVSSTAASCKPSGAFPSTPTAC